MEIMETEMLVVGGGGAAVGAALATVLKERIRTAQVKAEKRWYKSAASSDGNCTVS